jgi:hypothetical protein
MQHVLLDEEVETEFPPPIEFEEETAVTKAEDQKAQKSSLRVSRGMLLLGILSLSYTMLHDILTTRSTDHRLRGIESSLRILTQTVAPQIYRSIDDNLRSAVTQQGPEAVKSLVVAQASIRQLQDSRVSPDETQLKQTASLLANVTVAHPELGEGWATSEQLISYRTSQTQPSSPLDNCLDQPWTDTSTGISSTSIYKATFQNCILVLDDEKSFEKSAAYAQFVIQSSAHPNPGFDLVLENVHVVYRGGNPINAKLFVFHNCTFEFEAPTTVPPDTGKHLVRELLYADLTQPVTVSLIPSPSL